MTKKQEREMERLAGNTRYIAEADDAELARLLAAAWIMNDPPLEGEIRAEQDRRWWA